MRSFISELWSLLSKYKLRSYGINGQEIWSIPLSWLFIILLFIAFSL